MSSLIFGAGVVVREGTSAELNDDILDVHAFHYVVFFHFCLSVGSTYSLAVQGVVYEKLHFLRNLRTVDSVITDLGYVCRVISTSTVD